MARASWRPLFGALLPPLLTLAVAGCHSVGSPISPNPSGGVAVALVQTDKGSELVVVDLERWRVVRRERLRSMAFTLDGDERSRTVVTAQCGGPDRAADRAAGVLDLASPRVRYVDLPVSNPSDVVVCDGVAYLLHGVEQAEGVCLTVVDPARASVLASGHVPPFTQRLGRSARGPVLLATEAPGGPLGVLSLHPDGGHRRIGTVPLESGVVAGVGPDETLVSVGRTSSDGEWQVVSAESSGAGTVRTRPLSGVDKGVYEACIVEGMLVLADADGMDLKEPGHRLLVRDARDLREVAEVDLRGMPAALAPWNDFVLVADGVRGELVQVLPREGKVVRRLSLGGAPVGTADLVVFTAPAASGKKSQ